MKKKTNKKLTSAIALICSLIILSIYFIDLKNDYYFHITNKEAIANIEQIEKVKEYKPYVLTLSYLNDYTSKMEKCVLKLDGMYGDKILEENLKSVKIIYTKQSPCDIYIEDYKHKTIGGTILHLIIAIIALLAAVIFIKQLSKPSKE
ncbi:MAG: hypothetical protein ACJ77K_06580 [Bacteroidia bacterium]